MKHDGYSSPYKQTSPGPLLIGIDACPRLRPFLADLAPQPGGDADDLGLYAGDACLACGRFVTDMATRKFQIADVSGGSGAAGLSATRKIWASMPATPVWRADGLSPT
jgi:hypothetical protein